MSQRKSDIINDELTIKAAIAEIQSYIGEIEQNSSLYEEKNFDQRIEVIDFLGFQVIDQIEALLRKTAQPGQLTLLKHRAEKMAAELGDIDVTLYQRLRANIRKQGHTGKRFKSLVKEYVDFKSYDTERQEDIGYDNLDIFINGISYFQTIPEQTKDLEPEMVFYQKTPARIVFELVEKVPVMKEDVFFDLGAGLGQVAILVHLLTGITVKGIEFEPAFCHYARDCAAEFNLSKVTFINVDAREADYSDGTLFFMFTPFNGEILQTVLALLRQEARIRKIKIITYGPCTAQVALQSWLDLVYLADHKAYQLAVFSSF